MGNAVLHVVAIVEEAQHAGRRPVELAVVAGEGGVREDAPKVLADGGGADEAPGVVRREAQEDLAHGVVHQRRRRKSAAASHRRDHGERTGAVYFFCQRICLALSKRFLSTVERSGANITVLWS